MAIERHVAIFEFLEPFEAGEGIRLSIKMRQCGTRWFSTIGKFRITVTSTRPPFLTDDIQQNIAAILEVPRQERSEKESERLLKYYCLRDKDWRQLSNAITQFAEQAPDDPQQMMAQVLVESESPRPTNVLDRGGRVIGASDELGWAVEERPVHVHDFHATMLHLFAIDHEQLTVHHGGREHRLTDVAGEVIPEILGRS